MTENLPSNPEENSENTELQPKKKNRRRLSDLPSLHKDTKEVMAEKINYFKTFSI